MAQPCACTFPSYKNAVLHAPSSKSKGLARKVHSFLALPGLLPYEMLSSCYSTHSQTAGHKGIKKNWILIFFIVLHGSRMISFCS